MQGLSGMIIPMVIFIGGMYFLMIRPQKKRDKEVRDMRDSLKNGDRIITIGGIKGKVLKVGDDYVVIETSKAKTKMEFVKSAIGTVIRDEEVEETTEESKEADKAEETEEVKDNSESEKTSEEVEEADKVEETEK